MLPGTSQPMFVAPCPAEMLVRLEKKAEGWASAECMDPVGDFGHFGGFELHFTCLVVSFGSSRWFCFWLLGFCHFDGFDLFVLGPLGAAYLVGPLNR